VSANAFAIAWSPPCSDTKRRAAASAGSQSSTPARRIAAAARAVTGTAPASACTHAGNDPSDRWAVRRATTPADAVSPLIRFAQCSTTICDAIATGPTSMKHSKEPSSACRRSNASAPRSIVARIARRDDA
jgi:hypothetical protein